MRHIVALSGGNDSTAMALRLAETEPRDYEYVVTPTGDELVDMEAHWERLERLLEKPLTRVAPDLSLYGEILKQKCIPNWRMRWCTRILKIQPFQAFMLDAVPCTSYVGIRADEVREGVDHEAAGEGIVNRYPLVEWGWGLPDVLAYLERRQVRVPERTDCASCFFQRLGEWWRLWKLHPDRFSQAETIEEVVGHTWRSEQRDSWPTALKDLRAEFENGKVPRDANQPTFWGTYKRPTMCSICAR